MALIICTECGKEFSDKAPACPNCGCPTDEILTTSDSEVVYKSMQPPKKSFWQSMVDSQKEANAMRSQRELKKAEKKSLHCPKCGGHNIDLRADDANMKVHQKTSLNLNPLYPFTVVNTKEVKKEKKSAAKIGLGIMTGGASLLVTGTNKKKHNEYYCRDCGNKWIGK